MKPQSTTKLENGIPTQAKWHYYDAAAINCGQIWYSAGITGTSNRPECRQVICTYEKDREIFRAAVLIATLIRASH